MKAPVYAAVAIESLAGAGLALGALRAMADDVLPGAVQWGEIGKERGVSIVRVGIDEAHAKDAHFASTDVTLYYALTDGTLLLALNERTLRRVLGDVLDGHGPSPATPKADASSQLVIDLAGEKEGALYTVLSWLMAREVRDAGRASRSTAEALLVGARERAADPAAMRALAMAYFGAAPVPPEGGVYSLGPDGVRDPLLGTPSAPVWPALPVPGSPTDALLGAVGRFRSEIAFDREGTGASAASMSSLHVRVALGLRKR